MKHIYHSPQITVLCIDTQDIITESPTGMGIMNDDIGYIGRDTKNY